MKIRTLTLTAVAVLSLGSVVRADLIDIQALWSGASFGNGATAEATFTLDTSTLNNPGISSFSGAAFTNAFQNFQLTVTGATSGNGVFSSSDFSTIFLNTAGATLDFHSELVGQTTPSGDWGRQGNIFAGDFNFFSSGANPQAPTGVSSFTLNTSGGQSMVLTSFAPVAVPEPGTWGMCLLALGAVIVVGRRSLLRG